MKSAVEAVGAEGRCFAVAAVAALAFMFVGCGEPPGTSLRPVPDAGEGQPDSGADAGADAGTETSKDAGTPLLQMRAGAARIELIPQQGSPLAGFGGKPRRIISVVSVPQQLAAAQGKCLDLDPSTAATYFAPNEGTLDPLYVRALVLDDGDRRMAILKIDAVGFSRELRDELLPLAASLGIAPELLVGAATHTHSGPGAISKTLIWELVATDCFNQRAYDTLLAAFKRALLAAVADLRPARLGIGRTVERAANENRRGRPGKSDPELAIIKVLDEASGAPLAAVINYAIHGTVYGADNLKFSSDVLGFTEREIERKLGAGVALFLNAAEGDVAPAQGMHSGDLLSDAFVAAWPGVATSPHTELKGAFEEVSMPKLQYNVGCFPIPGTSMTLCDLLPGVSIRVPLNPDWAPKQGPFQAIRIGDSVLAMVPGEPITELGWEMKQRGAALGFQNVLVVGLANDHLSYFTTESEYLRGEYEGTSSLYGPQNGAVVVDSSERQMQRVAR